MDYFLTEEQQMIKEIAQKIAEERIKPVRAELDEKEEFPRELLKVIAQSDLFGVAIPQEYGGFGGGCLENCLAVEELVPGLSGGIHQFCGQRPGGLSDSAVRQRGTEKRPILPDIASGQATGGLRPDRIHGRQRCRGHHDHGRTAGGRIYPQRDQAMDHQRGRSGNLYGDRHNRPVQRARGGPAPSSSKRAIPGSGSEKKRARWASGLRPPGN